MAQLARSFVLDLCASPELYSKSFYPHLQWYHGPPPAAPAAASEQKKLTFYRNRASKLTSGLLSSAIRKGGNFNEPDDTGRIPLLSLAELASPQRNIFTTGTFAELTLGTSAKHVPPDWHLTDEQGNTALHLLFSSAPQPTQWRQKSARRGGTVQEFARMLCRDTAACKAALSTIDLLAMNGKGESIIRLIAQHCVHPRSRRMNEDRHQWRMFGSFWPLDGGGLIIPPERFPNCLHTHEKLYNAWMQVHAPPVMSVSKFSQRPV
jgi:hypothetical protein